MVAVALGGLILFPTDAARAADATLTVDAPAATQQLWVDLERPGLAAGDVELSYRAAERGADWLPITVRETAFGATAILPAEEGRYEFQALNGAAASALVLTFATGDGTVVSSHREQLPAAPETPGTPGGQSPAASAPSGLAKTGVLISAGIVGGTFALLVGGFLVLSQRRAGSTGAAR
ncbi:hypothetical protein GY24_04575 [Microterricola pindariensis]|uniref:CopC domain-containing protein n=2 Tax=Microterricola pindariensis TaxID=478010 RepID=A0ABX5AXV7_9MICO|nr:hypothetical protein GY24_04575 [Microterricola pindariensis]